MILVKKNRNIPFSVKKKVERHSIANREIYDSSAWRGKDGLRKQRLAIDPFCVWCHAPAEMVDHIKPINLGGDPWDIDNTQSMCNKCHAQKSATERK